MGEPRRVHAVEFFSPGMMVAEVTTKPVDAWDPVAAVVLAGDIHERHGATPYGFRFLTHLVSDPVPDGEGGELQVKPKRVEVSGMHYLGGRLDTVDDVEARRDPKDRILLANMAHMPIVVVVERGYRSTHAFHEEDVVVSEAGQVTERGDDPERVAYRARVLAAGGKEASHG